MRAGRLDRLVTVQRKTVTQSDSGETVETWSLVSARRAASIRPAAGSERWTNPTLLAEEQVEFQFRYSADIASLSPQDRIIYPALADESPDDQPDTRSIYDVLAVHEIGRREGLQVITKRRADVDAGQ